MLIFSKNVIYQIAFPIENGRMLLIMNTYIHFYYKLDPKLFGIFIYLILFGIFIILAKLIWGKSLWSNM